MACTTFFELLRSIMERQEARASGQQGESSQRLYIHKQPFERIIFISISTTLVPSPDTYHGRALELHALTKQPCLTNHPSMDLRTPNLLETYSHIGLHLGQAPPGIFAFFSGIKIHTWKCWSYSTAAYQAFEENPDFSALKAPVGPK